jgi:hypothetical protein
MINFSINTIVKLLELFISFVKNINPDVKIQILSSKLNYNILSNIKWCEVIIKKETLEDEIFFKNTILNQLKNFFLTIFSKRKNRLNVDSVFIDLIWDVDMIREYFSKWYSCIWPNLYLNNILLYYSLPYHYRWPIIKNLIDSYIDLIDSAFSFNKKFNNYVYENIEKFYDINQKIIHAIIYRIWYRMVFWQKIAIFRV